MFATPPLPREHGAWVMLFVPLATGFFAAGMANPWGIVSLTVAAVAAFLLQHVVAMGVRSRPPRILGPWLAAYAALLTAALAGLVWGQVSPMLLGLALPGLALFGWHLGLQRGPLAQRLDRQTKGQIATAVVLAVGGPAAWLVARGALGWEAGVIWGAFALAFVSGILHVNVHLAALKARAAAAAEALWRLEGASGAYHLGVGGLAVGLWFAVPSAWPLACGLAPYALRGLAGIIRRSVRPPSFKRLGIGEAVLACWLAGCLVVTLA